MNLLFLQPEVYSVHFLVWKVFYICYKYNFLYLKQTIKPCSYLKSNVKVTYRITFHKK